MNDNDNGGQQQQLVERFRSAIMACLENFHIDLRRPNCVHYQNGSKRLLFSDLYDMVVQMTRLLSMDENSSEYIYEIYAECATKAFEKFAENLEHDLQSSNNSGRQTLWTLGSYQSNNNQSIIQMAKILIEFWSKFKRNVLPFLMLTFQYVERIRHQQQQQQCRRMMLEELTRTIFIEIFFEQSSSIVSECWKQLIIDYVLDKHRQIQQYLWYRKPSQRLPLETDSIIQWPLFQQNRCIKMLQDKNYMVIRNLIQVLLDIGSNQAIYYKVFLIPFLETFLDTFLVRMSDQLLNEFVSLEYLNFSTNFIQMQSWFFSSILSLPEESLKQINLFTIEFLIVRYASRLINGNNEQDDNNNDGSFKSMLNHKHYDRMTQFYSLMMNITADKFLASKQNILISRFVDFLIKYHNERINWFASQYRCIGRSEAIEFVQAILQEHDHWDSVLNKVFKSNNNNGDGNRNGDQKVIDSMKPFSTLIDKYHYELMKIDSNVSQALAFYMHDLLSKDSMIMSLQQQQQTKAVEFETRIELLNRINFIIVYIKDINQFFDFAKHYFAQRLLTNLSHFTNEQEMDMMNDMNHVIRLNFMSNGQSRSFLQNLNDFKNIADDYLHSFIKVNISNNNNRRRRMVRNLPDSSAIVNAGTWKLTEFDRCWISSRLSRSFESLEYLFRQQYDNQKLFLNTKYSTAEVSMKMFNHDAVVGDSLKQSLILWMSLHQFAIIEQFNRQYQRLSYEMIDKETEFQKKNNLRIALLSLIYCGLIRPIIIIGHNQQHQQQPSNKPTTLESIQFELNDEKRFLQLIETNRCSNRLIRYEYVDFINHQPLDPEMAKIFPTIVHILTDGVDLVYSMSSTSVEDWNLTNILNSRTNTTVTPSDDNNRLLHHRSRSFRRHQPPPPPNSSIESIVYRRLISSSRRLSSQQHSTPSQLPAARTSSSTTAIESPNHLDSSIKIDAAIVRVLKRLRYLPNISAIYHAVRVEMSNASRKHLPPTPSIANIQESTRPSNRPSKINYHQSTSSTSSSQPMPPTPSLQNTNISMNDIQTRLIQLIDKRYVRRSNDGGFEYNIE